MASSSLRMAVAQTGFQQDPADSAAVRRAGVEIRTLMKHAALAGARLVQFPEGALAYAAPGENDWSQAAWPELLIQAEAIAETAAELGIWAVFGSLHPLSAGHRPHNSLYAVSDTGRLVTRYDKRFLSHTEITGLFTPGTEPAVIEVDGLRLGLAICIEAKFPEVFAEYERLGVDAVLLSVASTDPVFALVAQAYAELYSLWIGFSVVAGKDAGAARAGIAAPGGRWLAQTAPVSGRRGLAVADLDPESVTSDIYVARHYARPWRRTARDGLYAPFTAEDDPRSVRRDAF